MSHEPAYFNMGVNMVDGNFEGLLPHESNVTTLKSKPEHSVEIKISQNVLDTDQLVSLTKSDGESSLDINSSSNLTFFVSSSNVSESGIALFPDELNNETSESNIIGRDESKDHAIIHQFENPAAENVDDVDCYVVGSFKSTASVKNRNNKLDQSEQCVSVVECVDLTQDNPEETKLCDSLAHEFTKDTRLCILLDVIPDADPDFLMRKINEINTDDDLQLFVFNALETQNYPKIGAVEKILPNQNAQRAGGITYLLNEDVSRYDVAQPLDYSSSQHSALPDDNSATHFADLNSTISNLLDRGESREDPSRIKISTTIPTFSHPASSIGAAHTNRTRKLSHRNSPVAVVSMQYRSLQRQAQPKFTVASAKPHTVTSQPHTATSQETSYDRTSSNIPQTVTSHAEVRYPGFSIQDLGVSQQGSEKSEIPVSMYIHTPSFIPSTRTENNNPVNTHVTSHAEVRYQGFSIQDLGVSQQGSEKLEIPVSMYIPTPSFIPSTRTENNNHVNIHVTSHAEVRYQGFSIQDLRVSQQGSEKSEIPVSTNIPTPSFVSFTQTENNNPGNTQVNVPTYPIPSLQILAPNTPAPHATHFNAALPQRPENAHIWDALNINFLNPFPFDIHNAMMRQGRHYKEYWRRHRHHHLNVLPHYVEYNLMKESSRDSTKRKDESPTFNLLADILIWADGKFLRSEANKLKNDDDVEKFLLRAIANEKLWNKCVTAKNSTPTILPGPVSDNKYKILLELLPDANPTFLKRECAKLKDDEEVHEFAMKLGREQTYPKRKSSSISHKHKGIKRKHDEINEPETIDPKYQTLLDMLPDADPDFLLQESKVLATPDDLQKFVLKAVEHKTYPKRDQYLERQEYHKQWKKYIEDFNIKEFLQVVPNPVKFFYIDKVNSKTPLNMPGNFLQHRYRRKNTHHFDYFFSAAKYNLTKTCDILDVHFKTKPRKYGAWDQKTMFSTSILQEIAFIQNKKEIAHYLLFKEEMKLEAYEKGKTEGTLQECSCCYEDKLSEDMTLCLAGHMYCLNCIKRGSEVVIGNGGTRFPCYSEGCKEEFSINVLKTVLNPEVFSRLLIRKQYEEVNAAGIPGLETCSFCEFCSIPPAEDKLFRCLNPSCMKVTCRSCKKLDHLPLSCEEFAQKETGKKMQSYVEDKMTEALVRTCWQCGTKFIKENGCNMMRCKCGAKMCYFCRQPVKDYHHFSEGRCGKFLDTTAHDEAAVIKVGKKAKQEVEAANPGYSLPNDPTELLLKEPKQPKNNVYF